MFKEQKDDETSYNLYIYMLFMFHILRVWDDNEDCSIVVVVIIMIIILKEFE